MDACHAAVDIQLQRLYAIVIVVWMIQSKGKDPKQCYQIPMSRSRILESKDVTKAHWSCQMMDVPEMIKNSKDGPVMSHGYQPYCISGLNDIRGYKRYEPMK